MPKKHLGKGLKALFPDDITIEDEEEKNKKFIEIDVNFIKPNPYQPREDFSEEQLIELKNSIREKGIIQPVTVRKVNDGYELIAGERRLRAAKEIGIEKIPAYILSVYGKEELLEISIIENIQRTDLNPIELAKSYKRLIDECNLNQQDLAKKVSVDRSTIANLLRLLKLPDEVRESLKRGEITTGHARTLISLESPGIQINLLKKIIKNQMSVRELETIVYKKTKPKEEKKSPKHGKKKLWVSKFENRIRDVLGTKVIIKEKKEKGFIKIDFYSIEELEGIIELLELTEKKY